MRRLILLSLLLMFLSRASAQIGQPPVYHYMGPRVAVGNAAWMPTNVAASDGQTIRTAQFNVGNTTTIANPQALIVNTNVTKPNPNYRYDQSAASSITVTGAWMIPVAGPFTVSSSTNTGNATVTFSGSPGWGTNQWTETSATGSTLDTYVLMKNTGSSTDSEPIQSNTSNVLTLASTYSTTAPASGETMSIYHLVQWTFSGSASVTLTSGQTVYTDAIKAVIPYGGGYGQQLLYRISTTVASSSTVYDNVTGDNSFQCYFANADRTYPTSSSWGSGKISVSNAALPACVRMVTAYDLGRTFQKQYPIALVGDSLTLGWLGTAQNQYTIGYSGIQRALVNSGIGFVNFGSQGETAGTASTDYTVRAAALQTAGCTNAIICLGRNDLNIGSPPSAATLEGYLTTIYNLLTGQGIRCCFMTIPPATTSSDSFATTANQSTGTSETLRTTVNTWLRTGGGSTLSGVLPLIDLDAMVSVTRSSDSAEVWKPRWTTDGTHPNEGAIEYVAAHVDLSGILGYPQLTLWEADPYDEVYDNAA